jgi:hypothetical protein
MDSDATVNVTVLPVKQTPCQAALTARPCVRLGMPDGCVAPGSVWQRFVDKRSDFLCEKLKQTIKQPREGGYRALWAFINVRVLGLSPLPAAACHCPDSESLYGFVHFNAHVVFKFNTHARRRAAGPCSGWSGPCSLPSCST